MKTKTLIHVIAFMGIAVLTCRPVAAQTSDSKKKSSNTSASSKASKPQPQKIDSSALSEDGYVAASSTHIDFSETAIDGRMKVPDGFMLQGHQSSQLSQMVKLRSNFRNELHNSKSATKALVK
jgi:hypothetical protein